MHFIEVERLGNQIKVIAKFHSNDKNVVHIANKVAPTSKKDKIKNMKSTEIKASIKRNIKELMKYIGHVNLDAEKPKSTKQNKHTNQSD